MARLGRKRIEIIVSIAMFVLPATFGAQEPAREETCMRLVAKPTDARPELDGPGAFGLLHNTLTLGCLRVTSIDVKAGIAALRNEQDRKFLVGVGDYVGQTTAGFQISIRGA